MQEIKTKLYKACEELLDERLKTIQSSISDVNNALLSETKSSAGDKHETGRAMLQLEREKLGKQLYEVEKQKHTLQRINLDTYLKNINFGSVVETTQANYFIAISIGKLCIDKKEFYAISSETPMAKHLTSKTTGDTISFGNITFSIINTY